MDHSFQEVKQANRGENPARFQRTDQWRPVYSWLESLNSDEVIKSKDISDWLALNPEISEQLGSRHSRYHLMHYIKKCHMKILKKRKVIIFFVAFNCLLLRPIFFSCGSFPFWSAYACATLSYLLMCML